MRATAESVTEGVDLRGRTAVVTGATSGLGRECARVLALRGARVVIPCRSIRKGEATIAGIEAAIGADATGRCEPRRCDLTSMGDVRALASELAREGEVDLLLLNAGVFGLPFELTDEGHERTYAANYLGHFVLVHQLASSGALARDARIVSTLSEGVYMNPFARGELSMITAPSARRYSKVRASPDTKVLLALMAVAFTRRARDVAAVTFNGALPPATLTDNVNQGGPILRALGRAIGPLAFAPVERGAAVLAWVATSPDAAGRSGEAFTSALTPKRLPSRCTDPQAAERAWSATEAALELPAWPPA